MSRNRPKRKSHHSNPPKASSQPGGSKPGPDPGTGRDSTRGQADVGPQVSLTANQRAGSPSTKIRTWLSVWVSIHSLAVFISFTSVVEPSSIHSRLSNLFYPYLRPAQFAADDRPVYLAHGETYEQPHLVQVTATPAGDLDAADAESTWRTVGPDRFGGLAVSDRVARWLSTAAMLADAEEPGMVAELLVPIAMRNPDITAVRIVRLPTDLNLINAVPETVYVARVTRAGERVALIQLKEPRLSSQAVSSRPVSSREVLSRSGDGS